jgi:hypothetical protein
MFPKLAISTRRALSLQLGPLWLNGEMLRDWCMTSIKLLATCVQPLDAPLSLTLSSKTAAALKRCCI